MKSINPFKKLYLKLLSSQLKNYELGVLKKIDGIATISNQDKNKYLELNCPVKTENIPFGIETKNYNKNNNRNRMDNKLKFFHLGSMDWKPNLEAVGWLIDEIWPKIQKKIPNAELHLAGKNMPDWLVAHALALTQICTDGGMAGVTDWVDKLTGHPPKTLSEWVNSSKAAFGG